MSNCANCGAPNDRGRAKCAYCGTMLAPEPAAAPSPQPMYQQQQAAMQPMYQQPVYVQAAGTIQLGPPKSTAAAALLAFFLGGLGIHNFYLGYTGKGIAQLLLTIFGWPLFFIGPLISGIWAFVEFILILIGSYPDRWGRRLT